jgi:hypothetical protein
MDDTVKTYPEGHFVGMWIGICIAIFSGFGIPLSILTDNPGFIGIGPALGVSIGVVIGQSLENKYKQDGRIRPPTESEKKRKINAVIAGILILALGILVFILLYFL